MPINAGPKSHLTYATVTMKADPPTISTFVKDNFSGDLSLGVSPMKYYCPGGCLVQGVGSLTRLGTLLPPSSVSFPPQCRLRANGRAPGRWQAAGEDLCCLARGSGSIQRNISTLEVAQPKGWGCLTRSGICAKCHLHGGG